MNKYHKPVNDMCFDTVDLMPGRVLCAAVVKGFLRHFCGCRT